ncbi:hypothetical protein [Nocardia sp. NPDC004860]|uniref:hypothetical protein n=1 Tax=Nocardia sp. NPDC004860 TaxID=3154557 RepID=UPI0033B8D12C
MLEELLNLLQRHPCADEATRHPDAGHAHQDRKRLAGKTSMEALRALKRRLSNAVFACTVADQDRSESAGPGGQLGTTTDSSATGSNPHTDPSDKPHPGPTKQPSSAPTSTS